MNGIGKALTALGCVLLMGCSEAVSYTHLTLPTKA